MFLILVLIIMEKQSYGLIDNIDLYDNGVNSENDVITAIKIILISDKKEKYDYLIEKSCDYLDDAWNKTSPCNFENNICVASRNGYTGHVENGCCYPFHYSRNPFKFIEGMHLCEYLDPVKHCTNRNVADKLFVCKYLLEKTDFRLTVEDVFVMQAVLNKYQILALKDNLFLTKDKVIKKLIEEENENFPYFLYSISDLSMEEKYTPKCDKEKCKFYEAESKKTKLINNRYTIFKRELKNKIFKRK